MGRRRLDATAEAVIDERALEWRLTWLLRGSVPANQWPAGAEEAGRVQHRNRKLPLAEQIERFEDWLRERGHLDRAERLIKSLEAPG